VRHLSRRLRDALRAAPILLLGGVLTPGIGHIAVHAGTVAGEGGQSRDEADALQRKLEAIVRFGAIPRLETLATPIAEGEVNAYLIHHLTGDIPPGIASPAVRILGDQRVSATATLDLDALNASRPPADGFDPLRLLKGQLPAKVSGRLVTENGAGRFELDSAELAGIPLPRMIVSQLVTRYSISEDQPQGISLDDPFDLPASIREIRVEPGQVIVVQ